jgi:hypothetical protein
MALHDSRYDKYPNKQLDHLFGIAILDDGVQEQLLKADTRPDILRRMQISETVCEYMVALGDVSDIVELAERLADSPFYRREWLN